MSHSLFEKLALLTLAIESAVNSDDLSALTPLFNEREALMNQIETSNLTKAQLSELLVMDNRCRQAVENYWSNMVGQLNITFQKRNAAMTYLNQTAESPHRIQEQS